MCVQKTRGAIDILDLRRKSTPLPVGFTRQYLCVRTSVFKTFIKELRGFRADFRVVNSSVGLFDCQTVIENPSVVLITVSYN